MADMLNHKLPNETSWHFDQGLNAFTITTTKRLLKVSCVVCVRERDHVLFAV